MTLYDSDFSTCIIILSINLAELQSEKDAELSNATRPLMIPSSILTWHEKLKRVWLYRNKNFCLHSIKEHLWNS